jgi:hypothetical protein
LLGGFNSGAYSFYPNGLAEWVTFLDEFFEHANSIHPSITFTHEVSKTKMSFLDTTTTVKEGNMITDLYSKTTDKHQYLSPSSCHPKHFSKNIPFSQAIRVKRICSTVETTKQRLGDLRHHLKRQRYNDKVIESGFSKASETNRNDLLEYKEKKINKRSPLFSLSAFPFVFLMFFVLQEVISVSFTGL